MPQVNHELCGAWVTERRTPRTPHPSQMSRRPPPENEALLAKVDAVQQALIAMATQDPGDMEVYPALRRELMLHPVLGPKLPDYVRRYSELRAFWPYIKRKFPTYAERREFIYDSFGEINELLASPLGAPSDAGTSDVLAEFDEAHVHLLWQRALDRRTTDPEGAITIARTLLESVCKHILDKCGEPYDDAAPLPRLYAATASQLALSPSQHTEQVFKQILGSCQAVVEGLGSVRNRLSDAHGKGRAPVKPAPRHAELAVNLAGAMATFLVSTWAAKQSTEESP